MGLYEVDCSLVKWSVGVNVYSVWPRVYNQQFSPHADYAIMSGFAAVENPFVPQVCMANGN